MDKVLTSKQLKELQGKSLEIFHVLEEFCKKHELLFYFCGGCCIGTLRHEGFVPWDDDIDVFMPREDYEKLKFLWEKEMKDSQYVFCRAEKNLFYRSLISAVSDEETTFIKERQSDLDISHGIRVEILPLDGCPDSPIKRKIQLLWALLHQLLINQEPPTSKGKVIEWLGRVVLFLCPTWRIRYHLGKFAEKKMSKYKIKDCRKITELCSRWQYMVNEYPKEIFESAVWKTFEGELAPIPVGYDTYLSMAFGNYMELPPEESRIPKHDAVFIHTSKGYRQFKGKYYGRTKENR